VDESESRQHVPHREEEQRRRQRGRDPEAPLHVDPLRVLDLLRGDRARLERHPADRARSRRVAHDLRMHRAGPLDLRAGRRHGRGRFRGARRQVLLRFGGVKLADAVLQWYSATFS
jgi:hypothetical protein